MELLSRLPLQVICNVLPPQLAFNDKNPNPQGTTREGTTRTVTIVTQTTYPLTLDWLFSNFGEESLGIRITKAITMKLKGDVKR
jgi:hypothetical protein